MLLNWKSSWYVLHLFDFTNISLQGSRRNEIPNSDGSRRLHKCTLCNYTSVYIHNVKSHTANVHSNEKPYECKECNKFFKHAKSLTNHNDVAHGNKRLDCSECDKKFPSIKYLQTHVRRTHRNLDKKHKCPECPFVTKNSDYIKIHIAHKHRGKAWVYPEGPQCKKHKCDVCEAAFTCKRSLEEHLNWHKGIKNLKCDQCDWSSSYRSSLSEHIKTAHQGIKREKKYQCPHCRVMTHSKVNLESHINGVHNGIKPFSCEECNEKFASGRTLKRHVAKTHFKCSECNFVATSEDKVQSHMLDLHAELLPSTIKTECMKAIAKGPQVKQEKLEEPLGEISDSEDHNV